MQETEAYITIKDHKESFPNKIPCRLINPSKSSVGKISKVKERSSFMVFDIGSFYPSITERLQKCYTICKANN